MRNLGKVLESSVVGNVVSNIVIKPNLSMPFYLTILPRGLYCPSHKIVVVVFYLWVQTIL